MKIRIFQLALILISLTSISQSQTSIPIVYEYDAAGNRVIRKVLEMRSTHGSFSDTTFYVDRFGVSELKIFPNPTHGIIHVETTDNDTLCRIRFFNSIGEVLLDLDGKTPRFDIDLNGYPSGVYFVEIATGGEKTTWKIIKQ